MSCTISPESFDSLASCWDNPSCRLEWSSVFVLPAWLKLWWQEFKPNTELSLSSVRQDGNVIGVAPLQVKDGQASFIGSRDVCDYLDFVVVPGAEEDFFGAVLDDLKQKGIERLDLQGLRPESSVLTKLVDIARDRGYEVICQTDDVSVELELPATFDSYLEMLTSKQRHEVRRKMRRLLEAGKIEFRIIEDNESAQKAMDTFLKMFTESRSDKAAFLTTQRESFFRALAETMTGINLLRVGVLELDALPAAMILYFDFKNGAYLYNSGYNPDYTSLSVGVLSKVLCIQESIQQGKMIFDFLKGNEVYKYHLGGKEVTLSHCQITMR